MFFEWFALQKPLLPEVAHSVTGLAITLLVVLIAAAIFLRSIQSLKSAVNSHPFVFISFLMAGVILAGVAVLYIPLTDSNRIPAPLFVFLPLIAGAIMFGMAPAMLIGTFSGFALVLLTGGRITQPFEMALMAAAISWMVRQPWRGSIPDLLRQPLIS